MTIQYDPEADAAYIRFSDEMVSSTEEESDVCILDLDEAGNLVGTELLSVFGFAGALLHQLVSKGIVSLTQMRLMVAGYDGIKFIAQQNDATEKLMRHNPANPTSRVSAESVGWGLKGCEDGEADRLKYAPDRAVLTWNWDAMKFGGVTDKVAEWGKARTGGNY